MRSPDACLHINRRHSAELISVFDISILCVPNPGSMKCELTPINQLHLPLPPNCSICLKKYLLWYKIIKKIWNWYEWIVFFANIWIFAFFRKPYYVGSTSEKSLRCCRKYGVCFFPILINLSYLLKGLQFVCYSYHSILTYQVFLNMWSSGRTFYVRLFLI